MKNIKTVIWGITALGLFGSGSVAVFALGDKDLAWGVPALLFAIVTIIAGFAMQRMQRWGLRLSWALAAAAFGFGCYVTHFRWTFWLFREPTLTDRILSALDPRTSLFLIVPALWIIYSARARVRSLFH